MVLSFGEPRYCHNAIKLQCPAQLVRRTFVCTSDKYTQYLECLNHHLLLLSWVDQNSATQKQMPDLLDSTLLAQKPLSLLCSLDWLSGLRPQTVEAGSQFRLGRPSS
jgi:hypothetical protein